MLIVLPEAERTGRFQLRWNWDACESSTRLQFRLNEQLLAPFSLDPSNSVSFVRDSEPYSAFSDL